MTDSNHKSEAVELVRTGNLSALERAVVDRFVLDPTNTPQTIADELQQPVSAVLTILKRPEVRKAIGLGFLIESKERLTEVRNSVILALHRLASYDPAQCFDEEGKLRPIVDMPDSVRFAIKGFKQGRYGLEITFYDRAAIMQGLLQYLSKKDPLGEEQKEEDTVLMYPVQDTEEEV